MGASCNMRNGAFKYCRNCLQCSSCTKVGSYVLRKNIRNSAILAFSGGDQTNIVCTWLNVGFLVVNHSQFCGRNSLFTEKISWSAQKINTNNIFLCAQLITHLCIRNSKILSYLLQTNLTWEVKFDVTIQRFEQYSSW